MAAASSSTSGASQLTAEEMKEQLKSAGIEKVFAYFERTGATDLLSRALSSQANFPTPPGGFDGAGQVVSTSPFITVFENFLSDEECEFLKGIGHDSLQPAMVVEDTSNWYKQAMSTRNNEQHWLTPKEEASIPLLRHVLKRMHRLSRVPEEHTEAIQIGRYNVSAKYEQHIDSDPDHGVGRPMTLIVYLNDVAAGGETLFPGGRECSAVWRKSETSGEKVFGAASCCSTPEKDLPTTIRVKPKKGRAVLFYSHHPDSKVDDKALHIGCPVVEGEKWISQRWFRFEPYNRAKYSDGQGWDPRYDGLPLSPEGADAAASAVAAGGEPDRGWHLRKLSDISPRLFLSERFITEAELMELRAFAEDQLRDEILEEGEEVEEAMLPKERVLIDPLLTKIAARARELARLPPADPSCVKFRRLQRNGSEAVHVDRSPWAGRPKDDFGRTVVLPATVVIHLTVPKRGGEYVFPMALGASFLRSGAGAKATEQQRRCKLEQDGPSCCDSATSGDGTFMVPPRERDALLIYSRDLDGSRDLTAGHLVCAVPEGESIVMEIPFIFDDWNGPEAVEDHAMDRRRPDEEEEEGGEQDPNEDRHARPQVVPKVNVLFSNKRNAFEAKIMWISGQGEEVEISRVPAGGSIALDSFVGHVFQLYTDDGSWIETVNIAKPKTGKNLEHPIAAPQGGSGGHHAEEEL